MTKKVNTAPADAEGVLTLPSTISKADEARLRAAGWIPVVRWVDAKNRSDVPFKAIEVLTRLLRSGKK